MPVRVSRIIHSAENLVAYVSLFLLALFPFLEVIARKFFHTGIPNSTVYVQHLVLVAAFIAGTITSRGKKHLSLALELPLSERLKGIIHIFVAALCASMTFAFAWSSLSFARNGFDPTQKIGIFPLRLVALVMSAGYLVMAVRFAWNPEFRKKRFLLLGLAFIFGSLLAFPSIVNVLTPASGDLPAWISSLQKGVQSMTSLTASPLIYILIVSAFFGSPIFVILGGIGYLLFARQGLPLEVIPNQAFDMLTGYSIAAIPLFTITGFLLSESKAGERLVKLFQALFSWFPGGLAVMAVLVCAFFTTFTGASGVTILALGGLLSYILINAGYGKSFTIGLLTASGSIGLLFPPSLPVIVYGITATSTTSTINIKEMFKGGILPGALMIVMMTIVGMIYASKNKIPRHAFQLRVALSSFRESIWEVLLPVVIVVGYFGGLTTLVESAAVAAIYALGVEMFVKKDLHLRDLPAVLAKCLPIIGGVLTILALANGLSYYVIDANIPLKLSAWVQASISSKYIFLLILNLALLVVGCFMDIFSAILVVVPLITPLGDLFGIHPIHLGIIFLANMELGYLTPPVGLNLYLASYRFNEPMGKVCRHVLPFLGIQFVSVMLITYVPFFATALLK